MIEYLKNWYRSRFRDPQALVLLLQILALFASVLLFGDILAPILVSVLLAYVLEGVIRFLTGWAPRALAFALVYVAFLAGMFLAVFRLLPLLSKQFTELLARIPGMLRDGQAWLRSLPERQPELVSAEQVEQLLALVQLEVLSFGGGRGLLEISLDTAVDVLTLAVYVFLVPVMVFFLLKDKEKILRWLSAYLPSRGSLSMRVGGELNRQVTRYLQGKLLEVLIVWVATFIVFALFGLKYALLLSFFVGLSVLIPYVGVIVVTIPVALVALYQWGPTPDFAGLMAAYLAVQFLDGNMLVPILFSEVANLNPAVILGAILLFGGLWGVWGVVFAIPLASLVEIVLRNWPRGAAPEPPG